MHGRKSRTEEPKVALDSSSPLVKAQRFRCHCCRTQFGSRVVAATLNSVSLMRPEVKVKQVVIDQIPEGLIIHYTFVKVEVEIHDLLNYLLHLVVKGNSHVAQGVDFGSDLQGCILLQTLYHPAQDNSVFGTQIDAETLVEISNNALAGC